MSYAYISSRNVAGSGPDQVIILSSIGLIPPASVWPWDLLKSPTEMSTMELPGSKVRSERKAHNLIAICELIL
jgi:hypothetical protein